MSQLNNLLDQHESQLRGFALTGGAECLRQLKQSNGIGVRALADLRELTSERPTQQQQLNEIEPRFLDYKARYVTPFMRDDVADSALAPLRALSLEQTAPRARQTSQLKQRLQAMERVERDLIQTRARELADAHSGTTQTLIFCSACVAILALTLTLLLMRSVQAWQIASAQSQLLNQSLVAEVSDRRTIEESLRASETGFRHLAEDSLDMICRHAPDGTLTYVSPASLPLLGYAPVAMVGLHPAHFIFARTMDEKAASTAAVFAAQLRDSTEKPFLRSYSHADGHEVWLEVIGHAILDSQTNEVRAWHTSSRDVSARVGEERERARLLAGLRAVAEIADDLIAASNEEELLKRAVEMMCQRVGLKRCSIYLSQNAGEDDQSEGSSLMRGTFGTDENGRAVAEKALFYETSGDPTDDMTPAPGERWVVRRNQIRYVWRENKRVELLGLGWLARTPIATRGQMIGLFFHDSAPSAAAHDAVDQQLVVVFCSLLGALLERGRSQEHMNSQQRLLQSVMENAPLFLYSVNCNEEFTLATGSILPALGLDPDRMIGRNMAKVIPADSAPVLGMRRALRGEVVQEEMLFANRWLKMWRRPIFDDNGEISGMIGVGMDITQRQLAKIALQESETRYRQVSESLQDVLFQTDESACWTFLNPAWTEITGYGVAPSLGRPCHKILHPDDRASFEELLKLAQQPSAESQSLAQLGDEPLVSMMPEAWQRVLRIVTRPGEVRWIQMTLRANFSARGDFKGTAGTMSDVTEKVRSENALRETLEMKRAILQGASYAIISTDAHGLIQSFNPAAEAMFGASAAEVVGRVNLSAFHDAAQLKKHALEFARAESAGNETIENIELIDPGFETLVARARHKGTDEAQWNGIRADGTTFPLRISHSVLHDSAGAIAGYVSIGYDLTEAQRSEKLKSEFVSVVSHELRTPLTSIRGALGLLSGGVAGELPASAGQMIGSAQKNAERLSLLINDILDIEKIESGQMSFGVSEISLARLLESALETNRAYAQTVGAHIELEDLTPTLQNATITGDEARLQQVLSNLISNACKWTPTGTTVKLRARIAPASTTASPRVLIEVRDAGPGVPPEFEAHMFERFSQADSSATREKGGTGLGLAISQAIIANHGGVITYRAPDVAAGRVGATFTFDLAANVGCELVL